MEDQLSTNHEITPLTWLQPITQSVDSGNSGVVANLENPGENLVHAQNGKLLPGHPGLPGAGRPPITVISEAYRAILRREGAEKYAAVVTEIALTGKRNSDRLAAIELMTDRLEGKAVQSIRHAGIFVIAAPGEEMLERAFGGIPPADGDE